MNNIKLFTVIVVSILLCGCGAISYYSDETNPIVVKIEDKNLYLSDLAAFMETQPYGVDSLEVINQFVSDWILDEMKLIEAEKMFANNQNDIDILVDKYRKSLLIYKYDNYYSAKINTTVLAEDIVKYYNENKYQFKLSTPVVKARVLVLPKGYDFDKKLEAKLHSPKSDSHQDVLSVAQRDNLSFYDFNEDWVNFSDVTRYFPISNVVYDSYVANKRKDKLSDANYDYHLSILEYRKSGDDMPLAFVKDDIKKLILNQRRGEVFNEIEDSVRTYMEENDKVYRMNIDSTIIKNINKIK